MRFLLCLVALVGCGVAVSAEVDLLDRIEHGTAENDGVRLHTVSLGEKGPLVVMLHGFPDYWYTWREQMEALADGGYRVVAMDLRGYNKSDQPEGVEAYAMEKLVGDVVAVVEAAGEKRAIICGHDWGGAIAWATAMARPDVVERLMILNLPHPRGIARELATNEAQRAASAYARRFQQEGAHEALTAEGLTFWVKDADPEVRKRYVEAFGRSSFEGMLNYYKANYPRAPYTEPEGEVLKVKCPVLMIHGLDDTALLSPALNGTWEWLEKDLTLVTVPGAGHWVQQDAAEMVTRSMLGWLGAEND